MPEICIDCGHVELSVHPSCRCGCHTRQVLPTANVAALLQAADAYILALRQAWYGNPDKPEVRKKAVARLNQCGQAWTAERVKWNA